MYLSPNICQSDFISHVYYNTDYMFNQIAESNVPTVNNVVRDFFQFSHL
jgi:hypothetical protein